MSQWSQEEEVAIVAIVAGRGGRNGRRKKDHAEAKKDWDFV